MALFLQGNPIVKISDLTELYIEPRPIEPNPGRAKHGLMIFTAGQTEFLVGKTVIKAEEGDVVYIPKGAVHGFRRNHPASCIRFNFLTAYPSSDAPFSRSFSGNPQMRQLFGQMLNIQKARRPDCDAMLLSTAYRIVALIQSNESAAYISGEQMQRIRPSVEYLGEHFRDPSLTTASLAEMCGISERYYTMLFGALLHTSPKKYIIGLKVDAAKQLLASSNGRIYDIAAQSGFSDAYYFCRIFRELTGLSPTEYRRQKREI